MNKELQIKIKDNNLKILEPRASKKVFSIYASLMITSIIFVFFTTRLFFDNAPYISIEDMFLHFFLIALSSIPILVVPLYVLNSLFSEELLITNENIFISNNKKNLIKNKFEHKEIIEIKNFKRAKIESISDKNNNLYRLFLELKNNKEIVVFDGLDFQEIKNASRIINRFVFEK